MIRIELPTILLPSIDLAITLAGLSAPIILYFLVRKFNYKGWLYFLGSLILTAIITQGTIRFSNFCSEIFLSHYDTESLPEIDDIEEENIEELLFQQDEKFITGLYYFVGTIFGVNALYCAIIYGLLNMIVPLIKTGKRNADKEEEDALDTP